MGKGYLNPEHAANYADISVTTLYRWFKKGLPYSKANGTLIKIEDLDNYIEKRKVTQLV